MTSWAADLTWDGNVDSDWDTSTANWSGSTWNNATPDDATFGATATAGTVTLTENITAGNITFDVDGYTIDTTNGNLTITNGITANGNATISGANEIILGGDNTWDTASGKTLTVSSVISGGQALTKSGAGTLNLSGTNSYTGTTTISAGTVVLAGGNAIADSGAVVTANVSGALLQLDASETIGSLSGGGTDGGNVDLQGNTLTVGTGTYAGTILGTGNLTKSAGGKLTLSGDNTYTGTTTINGGTLDITGGSNNTSNFVVNSGILSINSGQTISTTADIHLESGAEFRFNRHMTIGGLSGSGDVIFGRRTNRNLTLNSGGETTIFSGTISESNDGFLSVFKNGSGNLTLSGTNTYRGATTVNAGTLILAGGNAIRDSGVVTTANALGALLQLNDSETIGGLTGGGSTGGIVDLQSNTLTIDIADGSTRVFTGNIEGTGGSLTIAGNGTQTLAGTNTYTGTTTILSGNLRVQNANAIADTGAVAIADEATATLELISNETIGSLSGGGSNGGTVNLGIRTLTVGNAANTTFAGNIVGDSANARLTKVGSGNLTLSGVNTYTGTTTVSAGSLILDGGNAIADVGVVTTANTLGARLQLNDDETIGGLTGGGANGGIVDLQSNTLTIDITDGSSRVFTGNIEGGLGGLTISGNGTQTLAGTNTYTGTTTVNSGTLQLQLGNAIADTGAVVIADEATATLKLLNTETIGSLSGGGANGGTVDLGSRTLTVGDTTNTTFSGNIIGTAGGLTKAGTGNLTLSGTNTFSGTTTINVGALILAGGNALADDGAVTITDGTGSLLQLDADETIGSLSDGGTLGGNIDLQAHTLTLNHTGTRDFAGSIQGTGGLIKLGSGRLDLEGTNTYSGATVIEAGSLFLFGTNTSPSYTVKNGGTLRVQSLNSLSDSSADVEVEAGGTFAIVPATNIGGLSGSGDLVYLRGNNSNKTLSVGNGDETTIFSGNISESNTGSLSLRKNGSGTFTLSGTNTHRGTTTVGAGTLLINSTTGSGTGTGAVIVNSGATLGGTGRIGDASTGNITIQSGGIHTAATVTTAGTQTILGDLTYASGATLTWNLISNSLASGQFDTFDVSGTLAFNDDGTIADDLFFNISFDNNVNLDDSFWQNGANTNEWKVWNVTGAENALLGLEYSIGLAGNSNAQGQQYFKASAFDLEARSDGIYLLQTSAVPEPGTFALMGLGLAAFGWARRSRKRTAVDNG